MLIDSDQADDFVVVPQSDALDPHCVASRGPHFALLKADRLPVARGQHDVARTAGEGGGQQGVPLGNPHGAETVHPDVFVLREWGSLYLAEARCGEEMKGFGGLVLFGERQDGNNLPLLRQSEQVHDGASGARFPGFGDFVSLQAVRHPFVGQEQDPAVGVSNQDIVDCVSGADPRAGVSGATPRLRPIVAEGCPLYVTGMGYRDHDVLDRNQFLDREIARVFDNLGPAVVSVFLGGGQRLVPNDPVHALRTLQEVAEIVNLPAEFRHLGLDPLALHLGQALEPEIQNRLGLCFGETFPSGVRAAVPRAGQKLPVRADAPGPQFTHETRPRAGRILGTPDPLDDLVEAVHRGGEAREDVHALLGPVEFESRSPSNHLPPEPEELAEHSEQREQAGPAVRNRQEIYAEGRLQRGVAVQVVQHHLGLLPALQLDDHTHAAPVRFVAEIRDSGQPLGLDEIGDLLDEAGLVDLVGDLGDHDAVSSRARSLEVGNGPNLNDPASLVIRAHDAAPAVDPASGRKVGPGHQCQ